MCNTPMTSLPQLVCPYPNEVLHRPKQCDTRLHPLQRAIRLRLPTPEVNSHDQRPRALKVSRPTARAPRTPVATRRAQQKRGKCGIGLRARNRPRRSRGKCRRVQGDGKATAAPPRAHLQLSNLLTRLKSCGKCVHATLTGRTSNIRHDCINRQTVSIHRWLKSLLEEHAHAQRTVCS